MRENQTSMTAMGVAIVRAIESDKPADQRICYDPYARHLVSPLLYQLVCLLARMGYAERRLPGVLEFMLARERYIDEYLQARLDEGLDQLVILGAGYDMRVWRFVARLRGLRVFEVDHPGTQRDKLRRLQRVLGQIPPHVTYIPVDFNTQSLAQRLTESGYQRDAKTLFIWQGVVPYLKPEGVDTTLAFIARSSAPDSAIIFDYLDIKLLEDRRSDLNVVRRRLGSVREFIQFGLSPDTIGDFLEQRGFYNIQSTDHRALSAYFTGANQGRSVAPGYPIVSARIKG